MSETNLAELKNQARRVYRHWPVFLLLQIRRAEKHLGAEQIGEQCLAEGSDELDIIRQMNFPVQEEYSRYPLPPRESLVQTGTRFWFRAGSPPEENAVAALDLIRFCPDGHYHRRELLRVANVDSWFVERAAQEFNRALDGYGVEVVFNAARLWASFSRGVTLAWETVTANWVNSPFPLVVTQPKKRLFNKTGKNRS